MKIKMSLPDIQQAVIKIIAPIEVLLVLEEFKKLENDIKWHDAGGKKQTGLQYYQDEDPWISATGRARSGILETDWAQLNPFFKDSIFEQLIIKYKLLRTRLMWLSPNTVYSMHSDTTPRVHIPLITNPDCYFVFQRGIVRHLGLGYVYWVDTTKKHTFMNCSNHPRLHLVGVVEK